MKKSIVFLLILIPILWISCDRQDHYSMIFREAEKLVSQHPDSALALLDRIEQPEQLPEATWARWVLLTTQARDKAFIRHTSDSTINRVITYYDHAGDRHQKALAYYYLGRVNSDLGQLERATAAYLRAYDYAEGTNDHDLTFRIASQAGTLFARQGLTHEALEIYQRAFNIARQTNDSIELSFSHSYLGRIYGLRKDWEQANTHYLQAIEISEQIQDYRTLRLGIQELSSIYVRQDRLAEALKLAKRLTEFEGMVGMPGNRSGYLVIGNIYRKVHQEDSAYFYLSQAIGSYDIYTRRSAYQALYYLSQDKRRYEEANSFNELYKACQDSIQAMGSASDLYQVKEIFHAEKRKEELWEIGLLIGSLVLVLAIWLVWVLRSYLKVRQAKQVLSDSHQQLVAEELRLREELADAYALRNQDKTEIDQLAQQLETNLKQQKQLELRCKTLERQQSEQWNQAPTIENVLAQLRRKPHALNETERRAIPIYMDAVYKSFTVRLREENPKLTDDELLLCCLIRLGFSVSDMAILLTINPNSVSKRKQRMRGHLKEKLENDTEMVDHIRNF